MKNEILLYFQIVVLPLVLTNILHMGVVKYHLVKIFARPIHEKYFGKNKTWRGLMFVSFINALITLVVVSVFDLSIINPIWTGFILGLGYVLFELPNSFLKRALKIPSGGFHPKYKLLFSFIDKSDSAFGVVLFYLLLGFVDFGSALLLFLLSIIIHISVSIVLVKIKIKKSF